MVRKSILVYDLLRTEQPEDGLSEKEIVEQISNRHDITAGKALRKQIAVALRRGLDFGIIAKKNNKFRFDPGSMTTTVFRREIAARKSHTKKKKKNVKRAGKIKQRSSATRNKNRKQNRSIPQPKLPKSWAPNRRNLVDEPVSKVKKI